MVAFMPKKNQEKFGDMNIGWYSDEKYILNKFMVKI